MIGIVVVSHSPALARAAVDLAAQMVQGRGRSSPWRPARRWLGTDATDVSAALVEAASPDGVLVLMDLGSAVLSAELSLELNPPEGHRPAQRGPLVEGLVAAVVRAAGGADLETVAREAESALLPKASALAAHRPGGHRGVVPDASGRRLRAGDAGQPTRPACPAAAQIATALGGIEAEVMVESSGRRADAASSLELLTLGAGQGAVITVSASGADAERAVRTVRDLVVAGFGELEAEPA